MNNQTKNSFDKETIRKVLRGMAIASTGSGSLYLLGWLSTINYGSVWTPIIYMILPVIINTIREYIKGNEVEYGKIVIPTIPIDETINGTTTTSK